MTTPVRPEHKEGKVLENKRLSPTTVHLTLEVAGLPQFKPGQFCWVTIETEGGTLKRPYSMVSAPWEEHLGLCIKGVGKTSNALCACKPGDLIDVFSPMGMFVLPEKDDQDHYLFSGVGTGIAPYRSMVRSLFQKSRA